MDNNNNSNPLGFKSSLQSRKGSKDKRYLETSKKKKKQGKTAFKTRHMTSNTTDFRFTLNARMVSRNRSGHQKSFRHQMQLNFNA